MILGYIMYLKYDVTFKFYLKQVLFRKIENNYKESSFMHLLKK